MNETNLVFDYSSIIDLSNAVADLTILVQAYCSSLFSNLGMDLAGRISNLGASPDNVYPVGPETGFILIPFFI